MTIKLNYGVIIKGLNGNAVITSKIADEFQEDESEAVENCAYGTAEYEYHLRRNAAKQAADVIESLLLAQYCEGIINSDNVKAVNEALDTAIGAIENNMF